MLTFTNSEDRQNQCFHLLGTAKSSKSSTHLISNNTSLISRNTSLLSQSSQDSCTFYSGPSDAAIISFGEQAESCGSIAYADSESCGSVAYGGGMDVSSGGDSACCASSGGGFSGGGCSYSC